MQAFDLTILEELVNINSQTYNISGVNLAQRLVADQLKDLGMSVNWHKNYEIESADAMVATYGDGPIVVTLLGHTDTVAKGGDFFPFEKKDNGIITGAGIADMKAGVAIIIDALTSILPILSSDITLQVVLSPNEEIGSTGFHHLFSELGRSSNLVLCFEPALEDGSFIHGRSGNRWYDLKVLGEKFHTGRAKKGRSNVLHGLCDLYSELNNFTSQHKGIKFNLSSFSSNSDQHNVSSSLAEAKMDVRFTTLEVRDEFHEQLKNWADQNELEIIFKIVDDCPPLENVSGEAILDSMKSKLSASEKEELIFKHCEGASDANYFSHSENVVIDGLGARGNYFHSRKEFIEEGSLLKRSLALSKFLINLPQIYSQHEVLTMDTKTA